MPDISSLRRDYKLQTLNEADVASDPFVQFSSWWNQAITSNIDEVNAMTIATINADGNPSARVVLLKGFDINGFVFFTNYDSHKGRDLAARPVAALVFFWKELERQVRIEGLVEKIDAAASDAYYASRPIGSRIGAWASPQSQVINSRKEIEDKAMELEQQFADKPVTRPDNWGGYVVKPTLVEFWQGRSNRLHDRLQYRLEKDAWIIERLAP